MLPVCVSASYSFMLPVATGPNALVYASGKVTMKDMVSLLDSNGCSIVDLFFLIRQRGCIKFLLFYARYSHNNNNPALAGICVGYCKEDLPSVWTVRESYLTRCHPRSLRSQEWSNG